MGSVVDITRISATKHEPYSLVKMFKLAVFLALVACSFAAPKPGFLHSERLVATAPALAVTHNIPIATSYANTYKVSVKNPVVATAPLTYAAAAPLTYTSAAPIAYNIHAAHVAYAAPVAYASPSATLAYAAPAW